ncbi:unnamed protein product [Urochloa decumbens]|uniref:F-box domain-containing protein n=1 Tax=Urochloa decumbens TaxID=240449 RepID=A0ABC9H0X3_9POAL
MGNHIHKAWPMENGIREPPDLPTEILLDIVSRADLVTVIRCAAASKHLRRHITDPSFRRRLHDHHADGFVPALLVGIFFHHIDEARRFVPLPRPSANKLTLSLAPSNGGDGGYFGPYTFRPVASRAGLVVLSRNRVRRDATGTLDELCVGSPVTGRYAYLPPAAVYGYSHVLLAGDEEDGAGTGRSSSSFRLLVLGGAWPHRQTQIFSSRTGRWGPDTEPFASLDDLPNDSVIARYSAVVVLRGVVAHWLCYVGSLSSPPGYGVLSIDAGTGVAAAVEIPRQCLPWRRHKVTEELLLARSAEGRLALLVAECLGIAMWTLSDDGGGGTASWARRLVVDRTGLLGSAKLLYDPLGCVGPVGTQLDWFGEASGTVLFQVSGAGILLLNLHTREISQFSQGVAINRSLWCCPYEMDLASVLAAMKSF